VPDSDLIESELLKVKKGQVIALRGYLFNVSKADGYRWQTSVSRYDTVDGACKILLVSDVQWD
jgi:hypothetical protein